MVPFGRRTAQAIDRYQRIRTQHAHASSWALWIGRQRPLADSAIDLMVRRRARQAGLPPNTHAHLFRHGCAHTWLSNGGREQDLMMLAGWKSRTMLGRYGASAAAERVGISNQPCGAPANADHVCQASLGRLRTWRGVTMLPSAKVQAQ
jgi:site-specific recombinase XerD